MGERQVVRRAGFRDEAHQRIGGGQGIAAIVETLISPNDGHGGLPPAFTASRSSARFSGRPFSRM